VSDTAVAKTESKRAQQRQRMMVRRQMMAEWALQQRRLDPLVRYSDIYRRIRQQFKVNQTTAEQVLKDAGELMRSEFDEWARELPAIITDAYLQIHREALHEKKYNAARLALDSLRDMAGLRAAINVNVNTGPQLTPAAFRPLDVAQLEALASIDAPLEGDNVIDVLPLPVEQSMELVAVAAQAMGADAEVDPGDSGEDSDPE